MTNDGCFYCRNSKEIPTGKPKGKYFYYTREKGVIPGPDTLEAAQECVEFSSRIGFSIEGYYRHMWFEGDGDCLELVIPGYLDVDLNEEQEDGQILTRIHICEFDQIERWAAFWGKELRKRGWNQLPEKDDDK
jgi:hypothetical protein